MRQRNKVWRGGRADPLRYGRPTRLADMIAEDLWEPPAWVRSSLVTNADANQAWFALRDDLRARCGSAEVIDFNNVSHYYFEHPQEEWTYKTDFPSCAPPFTRFFLEAKRPNRVVIGNQARKPAAWVPYRWGFLVEALSADEVAANWNAERERHVAFLRQQVEVLMPFTDTAAIEEVRRSGGGWAEIEALGDTERLVAGSLLALLQVEKDPDCFLKGYKQLGLRWLLRMTLLTAADNGVVCGPLIDWTCPVGASGQVLVDPSPMLFLGGIEPDPSLTHEVRDALGCFLPAAFLALSFMNCKNVVLEVVEPDRQLNRVRRRAGLKPFIRYHTINIEPMKKVLRTEGNVESEGLKRALHICRGHFATFSESFMGRPLAEPLTVWRPAHVRGEAKQGVVFKDYNVNPPKANP